MHRPFTIRVLDTVDPQSMYTDPVLLAQKISEYLDICYYGMKVLDDETGQPIINAKGKVEREHNAMTVPTFQGAAQYCGFASRRSLYEYERRGGDWADIISNFRAMCENWYVGRGVRPNKGDNPTFMSMILQARYGYTPATKQVQAGDPNQPVAIVHDTPEDVKRVLASLKLGSKKEPNLPDK